MRHMNFAKSNVEKLKFINATQIQMKRMDLQKKKKFSKNGLLSNFQRPQKGAIKCKKTLYKKAFMSLTK